MSSKKTLLPLRNTGLALHKLTSRAPRQKLFVEEGFSNYTVVSAVYNVGKYLHDFFTSIVNQTLSFENNIYLIMVDDGSTDDSAAIIKRWQKKFPDNILYLHKENGGQASARNMGLPHVMTEWVTFIDPDDFLDHNYFLEVDRCIERNSTKDVQMVCCNLIFYYEDKNTFSDTHPLNYRFKEKETILDVSDMKKYMCFSVNTNFFSSQAIRKNNVQFDCSIKPDSEDMNFIALFITAIKKGNALFIKNAFYFYRKRQDKTSTLDNSWTTKEKYINVIKSYVEYISLYKKAYGIFPYYAQRSLLYQLMWYLKYIINNPKAISHLDKREIKEFKRIFYSLFSSIEKRIIDEFNLAGIWFYHRLGILSLFKKTPLETLIVYIEDFDFIKSEILIKYYNHSIEREDFTLDHNNVFPFTEKNINHRFLDDIFCIERKVWIHLENINNESIFKIEIGNFIVKINCNKTPLKKSYISFDEIKKYFLINNKTKFKKNKYNGSWLMIDRDIQADDNAEHLYRYIKEKTSQKVFFIIRQSSHDWKRLKKENFDLIPFGSKEHQIALRNCNKIISSHIDPYIYNFFKDDSYKLKHVVFLQHGVTLHDISSWINKKKINLFITSSDKEYDSIISNNSHYKLTSKEVFLGGFPRHDTLLDKNDKIPNEKIIIVMPTWRKYLVGQAIKGNNRTINPNFMESNYAQAWKNFLCSEELYNTLYQYKYKIIFFPHVNIQPYLKFFSLPKYIEIKDHKNISIQDLFSCASIMITDYSSVAFEMACLKKSIIYYQFDKKEFFGGQHFQYGYFDYEKDGFGPIATSQQELFYELKKILQNDGQPSSMYIGRMENSLKFRDRRVCERIYNAISNLDNPARDNQNNLYGLINYAITETKCKRYENAIITWKKYYNLTKIELQNLLYLWNGRILLDLGYYKEFYYFYISCTNTTYNTVILESLYAEYNIKNKNYKNSLSIYKNWNKYDFDIRSFFCYVKILSENEDIKGLKNIYHNFNDTPFFTKSHKIFFIYYVLMALHHYEKAIKVIEKRIKITTQEINASFKPHILIAQAKLRINQFIEAEKYTKIYLSKYSRDVEGLNLLCTILNFQKKWKDIFEILKKFDFTYLPTEQKILFLKSFYIYNGIDKFKKNLYNIPLYMVKKLIDSLIESNEIQKAYELIDYFKELYREDKEKIYIIQIPILIYEKKWKNAAEFYKKIDICYCSLQEKGEYLYIMAYVQNTSLLVFLANSECFINTKNSKLLFRYYIEFSKKNWTELNHLIETTYKKLTYNEIKTFKINSLLKHVRLKLENKNDSFVF